MRLKLSLLGFFVVIMNVFVSSHSYASEYTLSNILGVNVTKPSESWFVLTHPIVEAILLCLVVVTVVCMIYGVAIKTNATICFLSFVLYLFGHFYGVDVQPIFLWLLVIGLMFVIAEIFLPGAVLGIIGFVLICISLIYTDSNKVTFLLSILVAIVVGLFWGFVLQKVFRRKLYLFQKLVLLDATDTANGYVSQNDYSSLLHTKALSITPLRPAGIVVNERGDRINAVSEGGYIGENRAVEIVKVEGARIVVRELTERIQEEE